MSIMAYTAEAGGRPPRTNLSPPKAQKAAMCSLPSSGKVAATKLP